MKTNVFLVFFFCFVENSFGKTYKKNLDPLKKLDSTHSQCDLKTFFSSDEDFQMFKSDLKDYCPSSLSKSNLSDEMKEKSIVSCQLIYSQLKILCSTDTTKYSITKFTYVSTLSKEKICQSKVVTNSNEILFKLLNLQEENPLNIDSKNLCQQIIDDKTTKLIRLIYKLTSTLSKFNLQKGFPVGVFFSIRIEKTKGKVFVVLL